LASAEAMNRGSLGVRELNQQLQRVLNPPKPDEPVVEKYGWRFQIRDKVIQTENNYEKDVFNGDIGTVESIDPSEHEISIRFDNRLVTVSAISATWTRCRWHMP